MYGTPILYSCPVYHDRVSKALVTESKLRAPTRGASVSSLVWSFDVWPPTGSYFGRARRLAPAPSPLVAGLFSPGPWVCFVFFFPFFFLVRGMARFKVELESVGNHVGSRRLFATLEFFTQVAAGVLERVLPVLSDFNPPSQIISIPIQTIIWAW